MKKIKTIVEVEYFKDEERSKNFDLVNAIKNFEYAIITGLNSAYIGKGFIVKIVELQEEKTTSETFWTKEGGRICK